MTLPVFHAPYQRLSFWEVLIKSLARICKVILPIPIVENARNTASIAVLFALIMNKIPIAYAYHFFNQRSLSKPERVLAAGSSQIESAALTSSGHKERPLLSHRHPQDA